MKKYIKNIERVSLSAAMVKSNTKTIIYFTVEKDCFS